MSVAPSHRMTGSSNNERDPEYVLPSTKTPTPAARATLGNPKKVISGAVTTSHVMSSVH